jgi:hypothetical protein
MTKELFALLMAGTLLIPLITPALGDHVATGGGRTPAPSQAAVEQGLPLPPVPYLEGVPWLSSPAPLKGLKVDTLFGPKPNAFGPFLLQPALPNAQVSAAAGHPGSEIHTE